MRDAREGEWFVSGHFRNTRDERGIVLTGSGSVSSGAGSHHGACRGNGFDAFRGDDQWLVGYHLLFCVLCKHNIRVSTRGWGWGGCGEGQDSTIGESLDLDFKDCVFEPHYRRCVFLVRAFSEPLTNNKKIMETPTGE